MADFKHGNASVTLPEGVTISDGAGNMGLVEVKRLGRARKGIGLAAEKTAEAINKYPDRLRVPGVEAAKLAAQGKAAEDIDTTVSDIETMLTIVKQENLLRDHEAHQSLRRVLAFVRAQEKFDPKLADLVPHLIAYFSQGRSKDSDVEVEEPTGT